MKMNPKIHKYWIKEITIANNILHTLRCIGMRYKKLQYDTPFSMSNFDRF